MIALWTQVKIMLVLWKVFLYFFAALKPKHKRPAEQIGKTLKSLTSLFIDVDDLG